MKIALLSPIAWRTPPQHYGPWEQVTSNICEGLVKKGYDVTLFATANSCTKGNLSSVCKNAYEESINEDAKVNECLHISKLMENASKFDIIHNNYDFLPLTYSKLIKTPIVTTIHGFSSQKIIPVFKKYNSNSNYVSISNSDRSTELDYIATVYNGIDKNNFTFKNKHGDYLLFFGRIHPHKGTLEAIQIAKKSKMKLIISGIIQDKNYYDEKIHPYINNSDIVFVGNSNSKERDKLLRNAYALLHPINFEEPFGLSVAESMFCGTPVIAFNRGSMPELIKHKSTGFIVNNVEEAVDAVTEIKKIDRLKCRIWAEKKFSCEKMVDDYVKVYKKILQ